MRQAFRLGSAVVSAQSHIDGCSKRQKSVGEIAGSFNLLTNDEGHSWDKPKPGRIN